MPDSPAKKLWDAANRNDVESVQRLIEQGVDIDQPHASADDSSGTTPLWMAAVRGHVDVAKLLVAAGCQIDKAETPAKVPKPNFDYNYFTPLLVACQSGHPAMVKLLLEHGADPQQTDSRGNNGVWQAIASFDGKKHGQVIELLVNAGVRIKKPPKTGCYLGLAANTWAGGYKKGMIKMLVEVGNIDPNTICPRRKCPPLHGAIQEKSQKAVAELLECGADPNLPAEKSNYEWSGQTALEYARSIKVKKSILTMLEEAAAS